MAAKRKTAKKAGEEVFAKLGRKIAAMSPPPIPKGEAAKVTIGNLRHQLKNLSERLGEKTVECNEAHDQSALFQRMLEAQKEQTKILDSSCEALQREIARLEAGFAGYREAIQDIVVGPID